MMQVSISRGKHYPNPKLLSENLPCNLTEAPVDVNTADLLVERRGLQEFLKVCSDNDRSVMVDGGSMKLHRSIKK